MTQEDLSVIISHVEAALVLFNDSAAVSQPGKTNGVDFCL